MKKRKLFIVNQDGQNVAVFGSAFEAVHYLDRLGYVSTGCFHYEYCGEPYTTCLFVSARPFDTSESDITSMMVDVE